MNAAVSRSRSLSAPTRVVLPQQSQQQCGDHGVDIDAENVGRGADVVERLDQMPVIVVEDVVVAAFLP